jgi:PIN domain nuclease of toxin-antitoxin system
MSGAGFLIDTHVLLWALMRSPNQRPHHREILYGRSPKRVGIATIWEIAIKSSTGKLRIPTRLLDVSRESDVALLQIEAEHAMLCADLPRHHGDPFDRMLIAQAQIEGFTILAVDRAFGAYGVAIV